MYRKQGNPMSTSLHASSTDGTTLWQRPQRAEGCACDPFLVTAMRAPSPVPHGLPSGADSFAPTDAKTASM